MSRFRKSTKSRQPLKRFAPLAISAHIAAVPLGFRTTQDPGTYPEGVNNGGITPLDRESENQLSRASGAPTRTPGRGGDPTGTRKSEGQNGGEDKGHETAAEFARRDRKDVGRGSAAVLSDFALEATQAFAPLKAVLGTISAIYGNLEGTAPVRNKIKNLLSRMAELETIFGAPTDDVEEQGRRSGLLRKLEGIEKEIRPLSREMVPRQLAGRVQDDEDVLRLLEGLEVAISDYQMVQQMAIYDQGYKLIKTAEAVVLSNFHCAQAAEYLHGDRRGCLKGTRRAVLDEIELWTRDFKKPPVFWLNGLAGTGKSTIAQTIAEKMFADGRLGASFFCSRDFEDRSNLRIIFPTLAVQLARRYPRYRTVFVQLIQSDPSIAHEPLYNQMNELIVGPLKKSSISTVIVIDALDECKDEEPASAILSVLGQFVTQIPKVKFFVTGRPEPRIREGFRLPQLAKATNVFVLHDVERSRVDSDIRLFFRHSFSELANRRIGLGDWPTKEQLDLLCERTAGLFVYAVATVKFIDHKNGNPKNQLDRLLQSPKNTAYEGKTKLKSNTTLDSLYLSILQEAFGDDDPEDDPKVRSILGAVVLVANPLSPSTIAALLNIDPEGVFRRLSSIHSLLRLQEDIDSPVRSFHKSFPEFIFDPTRCTNERFCVSPPSHHPELLVGCLELMNRTLEKNICKLPDAVANSEVQDLHGRTEKYINPALQYACKSWHKHLVGKHRAHTPAVASTLHRFLEKKFLFWLEVLSILGAAREAVDALEAAAKWLESSPALDLVNDCFRFVTGFFEIIKDSAPHIYHSALPLSPRTSIVRGLYESRAYPLVRIVHGLPTSWEQSIATMRFPSVIDTVVWSPCSRLIAVVWGRSRGTIEILDSVTLGRLTALELPLGQTLLLVFSPDARMLTWFGENPVRFVSWDLQTGSLVSTVSPEQQGRTQDCFSATYSTCGTMFGVSLRGGHTFTVSTYNVRSGTHIHSHSIEGLALDQIWTHSECLRFATMKSKSITTWEVGFTSAGAPTEVQSLPIPGDSHRMGHLLLHPNLSRLAFIAGGRVKVWGAQDSKFLLDSGDIKWPRRVSFSHDGHFFACGTDGPEFYLWKETPSGYTFHQKFTSNTGASEPLISPGGKSIVGFGGSAIQLWCTSDSSTSLSTTSTQVSQRSEKPFIFGFSPDGTFAAVTRMGDETVTVLDLTSGTPRLIIDTSMKVHGLGVGSSIIVVVGEGQIVTWNLPAGDHALDSRANINDRIRTTTFNHPPFPAFTPRPTTSVSPDLRYVAIAEGHGKSHLRLYEVATGQHLASAPVKLDIGPWFAPGGREVWCVADSGEAELWGIVGDGESDVTELEHIESTTQPPDGFPWRPPRGYDTTGRRWILSSNGKRLLWLPPHWRSHGWDWMWGGRFIALLDHELPESVILELEE